MQKWIGPFYSHLHFLKLCQEIKVWPSQKTGKSVEGILLVTDTIKCSNITIVLNYNSEMKCRVGVKAWGWKKLIMSIWGCLPKCLERPAVLSKEIFNMLIWTYQEDFWEWRYRACVWCPACLGIHRPCRSFLWSAFWRWCAEDQCEIAESRVEYLKK